MSADEASAAASMLDLGDDVKLAFQLPPCPEWARLTALMELRR